MTYYWKDSYVYKKTDPKIVGEQLEKIENRTPENIVAFAKTKKTEMHKCFEWDDTIAAAQLRLHQARMMTNNLVVNYSIVDEKHGAMEIAVNAFTSISGKEGRQYVKTSDALDNEVLQTMIMSEVKSYLSQARIKMNAYKSLFNAEQVQAVDFAIEKIIA